MRYVKAQDVLPEEILNLLQNYVDGAYLYIPRKEGKQKAWGEKSGIKRNLKVRNEEIYKKYPELADFSLMFSELRKIYNEKTIDEDIKTYVNNVCRNILINTAVFKETERGEYGINEFIKGCNL